ncbi:hypothetical protein PNEG_02699 [Pneumocystis murina B123]|uniref:RRM domain-containing protein n=1 Tax=Pneumocystis murina (strain B123) TaxID=1069680 RepID=M7NNT2_PNEMU|nr:hypothetical protein PNEG_02699 [Pneumocystis murina B123]EMR08917.1 hypothetical protein PNEG_02699 [Pneumocystis murina B123]
MIESSNSKVQGDEEKVDLEVNVEKTNTSGSLIRENMNDERIQNQGLNLFVTGIAERLKESELKEMFSVYGKVEKCQIMIDPHTKESRGFGFVQMSTIEGANAAREGLTGEERYGQVLSVDRARRNRPRTPTPGKYYGPPKKYYIQENRQLPPLLYHRYNRYNRYDYDRGMHDRFNFYYNERNFRINYAERYDGRYDDYYGYGRGYGRKKNEYFRRYYKNDHR